MSATSPIPPGTLDMLILTTLARAKTLHGFAIAERIEQLAEDVLRVEEGSLYPALQRLLLEGWIAGDWGRTAENRRARYYQITAAGRRQVEREVSSYRRVTAAIERVIQPA
jgi:PadR family transcriptional regulator PadR